MSKRPEKEQHDLFFEVPEPVWLVRQCDLKVLDVNLSATERLGYSRERFMAMNFSDFHSEKNIQRLIQACETKDPSTAELRGWTAHTATGETIETDLSIRFIQHKGEDAILICELDMRPRKILEERLRQAGKMEAIGMLAGGIAHDFNNLLTIISGYSQLLLNSGPNEERSSVEQILKASERAADLTGQLLAFSRRQEMQLRRLDVNSIVAGMSTMLRRLIGEHIDLQLCLSPELGGIHADPGQIDQVVMNLVVNARDAMAHGGKLVIETSNVTLDEEQMDPQFDLRTGLYVMIAVSDTGAGMSQETRARAFDPFFTTKEKGQGTGLGLSTVSGIVRQAGGAVSLSSEPNRGTSVKVFFPMMGESLVVARDEPQTVDLSGRGEVILLVEDEEAVSRLVQAMLESRGYVVVVASDGREALQFERQGSRIDLLLTDLVMPRMGGMEIAHRVRECRPGIPVIFMSGYTDRTIQRTELLAADLEILQKPFTSAILAARIRRALENSHSGSKSHFASNG